MKPLSEQEIDLIVATLQPATGGFLQEVRSGPRGLALYIYGPRPTWLWLDMSPARPLLLSLEENPLGRNKQKKPVELFLAAHARGARVADIKRRHDLGRVVELSLQRVDGRILITVHLIPHRANISIAVHKTEDAVSKTIHWAKPREVHAGENRTVHVEVAPPRSLGQIVSEWREMANKSASSGRAKSQSSPPGGASDPAQSERILTQLRKSLETDLASRWSMIGDALKAGGALEMSAAELRKLGDGPLGVRMERAYIEAKKQREKRTKVLQRISELEGQAGAVPPAPQRGPKSPPQGERLHYRTGRSSGGWVVHVGKTAQDNLRLLRESAPWTLWIHLQDYPSAHGFIPFNKGAPPPEKELRELLVAFARLALPSHPEVKGLTVLLTECRFVSPIKGAPGRVTYRNERRIRI